MIRRDKWTIRASFRIAPSKDGETSSEGRMAYTRIPFGLYPVLPTAISFGRYLDIQNNEVSFPLHSRDDLQPGILTVPAPLSSFRRIDPTTTTLKSTKSEVTGQSEPLSGLSRPRAMGPLRKIGWRKSGSLPDLTQSYGWLSHLDVTHTSKGLLPTTLIKDP